MIKTVVFDMDGVLIDTETICAAAWRKNAKLHHTDDIETTITECIGLNAADTEHYFLQKYGNDFDFRGFQKDAKTIFNEIAQQDGIAVKTGVYEVMEYLKNKGYRIGLASSSGKKSVELHMTSAGLMKYFEVVVTGDMVVHSKPHPEIYLMACEKLGVAPQDAYAVEDSFNGIKSAHQAGMKVIMVPDMIAPTNEIKKLLTGCFENLTETIPLFDLSNLSI